VFDEFTVSGTSEIEEVLWSFLKIEVVSDDGFIVRGRNSTLRGTFSPVPPQLTIDEVPNAVFSDTAYAVVAKFEVNETLGVSMRLEIDTSEGRD